MSRTAARVDSKLARRTRAASRLGQAALGSAFVLATATAHAHIKLLAPPSWVVESALGDPQKTAPCGGTTGTPTGAVTTFHTGETITVEWKETVGHPGHFRISLATSRADLVDPAVVTTNGDGVSGTSISAAIESPPVYPVLLDGLFPRTSVAAAQVAPFSQKVTLPGTPCDHCTLQVVQFMAGHAPGYFYHHCADLRIVAPGTPLPADGGAGATLADAGPISGSASDSGGCTLGARRAARAPASTAALAMLCLGAALRRRRSPSL